MTGEKIRKFLIVLALMSSCCVRADLGNYDTSPPALYCRGMGYNYSLRDTENLDSGICILPDKSIVSSWDFLTGVSGQQYSYCRQMGYPQKVVEGNKCPQEYRKYSNNCLMCLLPGGKEVEVLEFMGLRASSSQALVDYSNYVYIITGLLLIAGLLAFFIYIFRSRMLSKDEKFFLEEKMDMISLKMDQIISQTNNPNPDSQAGGDSIAKADINVFRQVINEIEEERNKVGRERVELENQLNELKNKLQELEDLKSSREKELMLLQEERRRIAAERSRLESSGALIKEDIESRYDSIRGAEKKVENYKELVERDTKKVERDTRIVEADTRLVEKGMRVVDKDRESIESEKRRIEEDRKEIEAMASEIEARTRTIQKEEQRIANERKKVEETKARVEYMMKEMETLLSQGNKGTE